MDTNRTACAPIDGPRRQAYIDKAVSLHEMQHNCAQCVAVAGADIVGANPDDMFKLMEGFGAGMGSCLQTCGALSGGVALLGMANSSGRDVRESKLDTYAHVSNLVADFEQACSGTQCQALKEALGRPGFDTCVCYIAEGMRAFIDAYNGLGREQA